MMTLNAFDKDITICRKWIGEVNEYFDDEQEVMEASYDSDQRAFRNGVHADTHIIERPAP